MIEPINHKVWSISYKKPDGGLVPGGNIEINVKFICPQNTENNSIYQENIFTGTFDAFIIKNRNLGQKVCN